MVAILTELVSMSRSYKTMCSKHVFNVQCNSNYRQEYKSNNSGPLFFNVQVYSEH